MRLETRLEAVLHLPGRTQRVIHKVRRGGLKLEHAVSAQAITRSISGRNPYATGYQAEAAGRGKAGSGPNSSRPSGNVDL
jgi:hypothetical protein